jgi:hypothetical protein
VRTDGRKIGDDAALLQQGKGDIAACDANFDSGTPTTSARGCMAQKGYVIVQRDQAEDVRAAHATAAVQFSRQVRALRAFGDREAARSGWFIHVY